jgi:hypothetical protein
VFFILRSNAFFFLCEKIIATFDLTSRRLIFNAKRKNHSHSKLIEFPHPASQFAIARAPIQICGEVSVKKFFLWSECGIKILVNEPAVCRRPQHGESFSFLQVSFCGKKKCGKHNLLLHA